MARADSSDLSEGGATGRLVEGARSGASDRSVPVEELDVEQLRNRLAGAERGLVTARLIGTAVGILMERHKLSAERAFARLSRVSQDSNVRVADLAELLVHTGVEGIDGPDRRV